MLTFMKVSHQTYCIKLSRACSKTTWLPGYVHILQGHMASLMPKRSWMTSIRGWYVSNGSWQWTNMIPQSPYRIAVTPPFLCLQWFKQGQRFKQWTGDDSKVLMKASTISLVLRFAANTLQVFIPAIVEYVPPQVVTCLSAFLDFCYLIRCSEFGQSDLIAIEKALNKFHSAWEIFCIPHIRCPLKGIQSPMPTLHGALCTPYSRIWSTQWVMFLNYWVLPHYHCEENVASLKSLWAPWSDFANKPETWQACSGTCTFHSTWDVIRRANDSHNPKTSSKWERWWCYWWWYLGRDCSPPLPT